MADSLLLKYARVRNDADFRDRVAAAMLLKAQAQAQWELQPADRQLTDWILQNPMVAIERMVALVATNPTVASNVKIQNDAVKTNDIPDGDIIFVVEDQWDEVCAQIFGTTVASSDPSVPPPA